MPVWMFEAPLSGLTAASAMYDLAAHDVANADTPGFRALGPVLTELPAPGGVAVAGVAEAPAEGVDLAEEMTDLVLADGLYAANARMLGAQSSLYGYLFDARA